MTTKNIFRIHPTIGIARVGNSDDYYLGPETMAGMDGTENDPTTGGLPIKVGEETKTITSDDLRDSEGKLKRQAARFKIFVYNEDEINSYPSGAGSEIKVGSTINFGSTKKVVKTILWQVHLANKKANSWIEPKQGIGAYYSGDVCDNRTPTIRNLKYQGITPPKDLGDKLCCNSDTVLNNPKRLKELVIDAGPHVVAYGVSKSAFFNTGTQNEIIVGTGSKNIDYPKLFPTYLSGAPENETIESLGEMHTDDQGRLLVVGAYGKASGFTDEGKYDPEVALKVDVNNNNWFDDTADGPVTAVILFEDGTTHEVDGSSWVITTDPSYAPQIPNVVSLWEDLYNTWVEKFDLEPSLFNKNNGKTVVSNPDFDLGEGYNLDYKPDFDNQIKPILNAANLQMWATNLVEGGQGNHKAVAELPKDNPGWPELMSILRNPNLKNNNDNTENKTRMPLSLGDSEQDFLAISRTQYFFIYQWLINGKVSSGTKLGAGELLDRNVLGNCLGGRFSPGIEMTFTVRDKNLFQNWKKGDQFLAPGPFRINMEHIDYDNLSKPVLGVGYTPLRTDKVEPGDFCKFMSIPWHTDYNSCATHTTVPNEQESLMTYWSWPAQRPVAVYTYDDVVCHEGLKFQRFSVRGEGTNANYKKGAPETASARVGRYQDRNDFLKNWQNVGVVIQGTSIDQKPDEKEKVSNKLLKDSYLEVRSKFEEDESNYAVPGPIPENQRVSSPEPGCPHIKKTEE
jgi:hypothetical protein